VARRTCPNCKKTVEVKVENNGNKVVKKCPNCNYVFIEYEIRRNAVTK